MVVKLKAKTILICAGQFEAIKVAGGMFASFAVKKKPELNEERKKIVAETQL